MRTTTPTEPRRPSAGAVGMLRPMGTGVLLGAGWGVLARLWMRMISTQPEFSWAGTLLIIGFAMVGGLGLGMVHGARSTGRRRWWRLAVVLALPISSMAQGIVFAPAFWLGGIALAGRAPRLVRWALVALAAAPAVVLWATSSALERELVPAPTFLVGFWLLATGMAYGGSQVFRRWPRGAVAEPSADKTVGAPASRGILR